MWNMHYLGWFDRRDPQGKVWSDLVDLAGVSHHQPLHWRLLDGANCRFDGSQQTFPKLLQAAGYQTAVIGKWHLVSDPQGFDHWHILPAGTEGYAKAEVTAGGVDTRELSSQTMESKRVAGLHFIGEVVDVTGWLGGYNFQWAWASAMACARALQPLPEVA